MKKYFKIGEISKLYNIGVDSLRYYEEIGLISPERADSRYRMYSIDDIWRLNVIRELREIGFPMKKIKEYLNSHTIDTTLNYLNEELQIADKLIDTIIKLKANVTRRMDNIEKAKNLTLDTISIKYHEQRNCFQIAENYSLDQEMDILIKRLVNIDKSHFFIIGNNQIGSIIDGKSYIENRLVRYKSAFIIAENGDKILPSGNYLSISYNGDYKKTSDCLDKLTEYAKVHNYTLTDTCLELLWTDIHTSLDPAEHITEIEILIKD